MLKFYGQAPGETYNYLEAKQLGCQIITIPPKIIEQIKKSNKTFKKLT